MRRREFVAGVGAVMAAGYAAGAEAPDDAAAVKQAIADNYAAYSGSDQAKYRATLADDYVLLEHGELLGLAADLANMESRDSAYKRKDVFDFRSVTVEGSLAYAVHFLDSDITTRKGQQQRRWLEIAILRRSGSRCVLALLHSTRIGG